MLLQAIFFLAGFPPPAAHRCILLASLSLLPGFSLLPIPAPRAPLSDPEQPPLAERVAPLLIPVLIVATIYPVLAVCWGIALSALCM